MLGAVINMVGAVPIVGGLASKAAKGARSTLRDIGEGSSNLYPHATDFNIDDLKPLISDSLRVNKSQTSGPILVSKGADGKLTIMDGSHRYWEAKDRGERTVQGYFDPADDATSRMTLKQSIQAAPEYNRSTLRDISPAGSQSSLRGLDPSTAARMSRAEEGGFDTSNPAYRGLYGEYDPDKTGNYQMFTSSPEDAGEYGNNVVSAYLKKGNNLAIDAGRNNFNSIPISKLPKEVRDNLHPSIGSEARTDDIGYAAQKAGYDSVSINNVFDKASNEIPLKPSSRINDPLDQEMLDLLDEFDRSGMSKNVPNMAPPVEMPKDYDPATINIIFDPKNIRSTNAEFDPAKADSANLLSGIYGRSMSGAA